MSFSGIVPRGAERERWQVVKDAAMEAVVAAGGTVTHTTPWGVCTAMVGIGSVRGRSQILWRAAKRSVDPNGILNPGVLIDP